MLALGLVLSAAIGVALGLLGGGGSILTVPTIHYVFGLDAHAAIATSLAVVAITGLAALYPHARAGRVQWRIGFLFGAASMAGAYTAARVAGFLPGTLLLVVFGAVMLVTAAAMLRGRRAPDPGRTRRPSLLAVVAQGVGVGAVAGLVGAGGGFLIVPALVLLAQLPMCEAVATSLLVIVLNSIAGFVGASASVPIHGRVIAIVAAIAVVGSVGGAHLAGRIRPDGLRRLFGWFVIVMAVFVLAQELPRALGYRVELSRDWPLVLGAVAAAVAAGVLSTLRRREPRPPAPPRAPRSPGGSADAVSPALRS
jgi:uncharacterized membrane protein YfcA